MRIRGRGVAVEGEKMAWFFDLDGDPALLRGYFQVDGWDASGAMNLWYEKNSGKETVVNLEGFGYALVIPLGIRIHESGHHNESVIRLEGSLLHRHQQEE